MSLEVRVSVKEVFGVCLACETPETADRYQQSRQLKRQKPQSPGFTSTCSTFLHSEVVQLAVFRCSTNTEQTIELYTCATNITTHILWLVMFIVVISKVRSSEFRQKMFSCFPNVKVV